MEKSGKKEKIEKEGKTAERIKVMRKKWRRTERMKEMIKNGKEWKELKN